MCQAAPAQSVKSTRVTHTAYKEATWGLTGRLRAGASIHRGKLEARLIIRSPCTFTLGVPVGTLQASACPWAIPEYAASYTPAQTQAFPVSIRGHDPHFEEANRVVQCAHF